MRVSGPTSRNMVSLGERLLGRTIAIVLGIVLMLFGVGMGVTMVMLPVGVPVGLAGLMLLLWGLSSSAPQEQT
jgi:hypothetical protein